MKSVRILLTALVALAVAVTATGCGGSNVAAKVNGKSIQTADLDKAVDQMKQQYKTMFEGPDAEGRILDLKQRLLEQLINRELMRQGAEELGVQVTDDEVKAQLDELRKNFESDEAFQQALSGGGMTVEGLEEQIREQLLSKKLMEKLDVNDKVSDKEIKEYFDKNKASFNQPAAKRTSHILFKGDDEKTARAVLKQIREGADFGAMAKKYSIDEATKGKGGDRGYPNMPDPAEYTAAVADLDKGEISDVVRSPLGWHIIKVTEVRPAKNPKLADVKAQVETLIVSTRRSDAYNKFLTEQRAKAKIEILLKDLKEGPASQETTSK